jgi:hypothetical protein
MALMLEAAVSAVGGTRSRERTHRLLDAGRALGAGQEIPSVRSAQALMEGVVAIFEGRWLHAHDQLDVADRLCAAVSALPGHGSLRALVWCGQMVAMFWLGRAGDLLRETQSLLRLTEERGNFVGWVWLQLLQSWALGCTGQVEAGLAAADEVRRRLPAGRFELPRWYLEFGHVKFALEQGDADEAWRRVEAARRNTRFWLTGQTQRISAHWVSAAAAVTRAAQNPSARPAMLAEARRLLRRIERERAPWAAGIARALQAGMASVEGDRDGALRLLGESEPLLEAHHLELALAAVRAVRGRLLGGGHGRALCAQAAAWTAAQRISPEALRMHAPGSWPE